MANEDTTEDFPALPEEDSAHLRAIKLGPIAGPSVVFCKGSSEGTDPYSDRLMPHRPTSKNMLQFTHQ